MHYNLTIKNPYEEVRLEWNSEDQAYSPIGGHSLSRLVFDYLIFPDQAWIFTKSNHQEPDTPHKHRPPHLQSYFAHKK